MNNCFNCLIILVDSTDCFFPNDNGDCNEGLEGFCLFFGGLIAITAFYFLLAWIVSVICPRSITAKMDDNSATALFTIGFLLYLMVIFLILFNLNQDSSTSIKGFLYESTRNHSKHTSSIL